ncbi:polynucleotide 5'-hydroxyl-kinase NOL9-like isoform X2 [Tigriopus californicus]|nr:polynucleotide 5'-hydroxyl-kinase NOL9-like isoform X2 [Tigriopus californicus]|eukprot:TCALIF_01668-PA protein Name:"Similar to CG8414 Polynucleotide 5'-hydroxyl-kinase NOL9 (Drosophila melanogaster)" AED:0.00 eAED:0.00 QI:264/1/1/1/1/1/3/121/599
MVEFFPLAVTIPSTTGPDHETPHSGGACLAVVPMGQQFHLKGRCRLSVWSTAHGIRVLGWQMTHGQPAQIVASPRGYSLLAIEAVPTPDPTAPLPRIGPQAQGEKVKSHWSSAQATSTADPSAIPQIRARVRSLISPDQMSEARLDTIMLSPSALVYCQAVNSDWQTRLESTLPHVVNIGLFGRDWPNHALSPLPTLHAEAEKRLNVSLVDAGALHSFRLFTPHPSWASIWPDPSSAKPHRPDHPPRIFVAGGKGVGKSTLAKWLFHQLLGHYPQVVWVDLDPGQSELSIPGFICASVLASPLLGPNFTHLDCPLHTRFFVGDIDVCNVMQRYKAASRLMASVLAQDQGLGQWPWVINNLGFTGSIGLSILREALLTWRPSTLVSITSVSQRKNYPADLSTWTRQLGLAQTRVIRLPAVPERTSDCRGESRPTHWGLPEPRKLREIVLLAFLAHFPRPLKEMEPYVVSLDAVRVNILDRNVGASPQSRAQYLFRMNASIVSLECDRFSWSNDKESDLNLSVGVGIIRGIDVERNEIYVVTNLHDQSVLANVSCITVGMIRLPDSVFLDQPSKLGLPYVGGTLFQTPLSQPWIKGGRPRN